MEKSKPKVFISYTLRDGKINKNLLNNLHSKNSIICEVYIDLIHNDSIDKQNRVIRELNSSDFIILIRTEQVENSKWVKLEILLAKNLNIPIIEFELEYLIKNGFQSITTSIENFLSIE